MFIILNLPLYELTRIDYVGSNVIPVILSKNSNEPGLGGLEPSKSKFVSRKRSSVLILSRDSGSRTRRWPESVPKIRYPLSYGPYCMHEI